MNIEYCNSKLFFSDVTMYEPDADMIFNYLMVSALANSSDIIEKRNLKATGGMYKWFIHNAWFLKNLIVSRFFKYCELWIYDTIHKITMAAFGNFCPKSKCDKSQF